MKATGLAVRLAWRGLMLRKGRAALMMAGVTVGVVTLTLVVSVTQGVRAKVEREIQNFGPDAIMIVAGSPQTRGPGDERVTTLIPDDLAAVRRLIGSRARVFLPMVVRLEQTLIFEGANTTASVWGATPDFEEAWDWRTIAGEHFSESHEASAGRVAVLGTTVVRDLFGDSDPVGQTVRIGDQRFRVLGVLAPRGTSPMGLDMDNRVVVPLSTAMRRLFNVTWYSLIRLRVAAGESVGAVAAPLAPFMRERHHIGAADTDDFHIRTADSLREMGARLRGMLTLLLGIVTAISLFAGTVVLANILQASVAERRMEIGLARALGATRRHVIRQFFIEGLVVTLAGGALGVALGSAAALVLARLGVAPTRVSWEVLALALAASLLVGTAASLLPARRAARLDPAAALRP
jgi:putative ABC transport system permease protein